jgi:hypothetical protein
MVWSKENTWHYSLVSCSYHQPLERSKRTTRQWEWMVHTIFWSVLLMWFYWLEEWIQYRKTAKGLWVFSKEWTGVVLSTRSWLVNRLLNKTGKWRQLINPSVTWQSSNIWERHELVKTACSWKLIKFEQCLSSFGQASFVFSRAI